MLPVFNQASRVQPAKSFDPAVVFKSILYGETGKDFYVYRPVFTFSSLLTAVVAVIVSLFAMISIWTCLLRLGGFGLPLLWLGLVWLQCWHVGSRKWPPSRPGYPHSTPPVFSFSSVMQRKDCRLIRPHWGTTELSAGSLCRRADAPRHCCLYFFFFFKTILTGMIFCLLLWKNGPLSLSSDPLMFPRSS